MAFRLTWWAIASGFGFGVDIENLFTRCGQNVEIVRLISPDPEAIHKTGFWFARQVLG